MKNNERQRYGFAVWITGLPGAGKSVTAESLKRLLEKNNISVEILRMDEMRNIVTPNPTYKDKERELIYNSFCYITKKLTENGINVIMDATGNKRKYRKLAKEILNKFMEVYIKCPLKIAIEREMERKDTQDAPKDIYEKAMKGESTTVPGIGSEYQEPKEPDLIVESDKLTIQESAQKIYEKIKKKFL